jgi:hypothetical protein
MSSNLQILKKTLSHTRKTSMPIMKDNGSWKSTTLHQEKETLIDENKKSTLDVNILSVELLNSINILLLNFKSKETLIGSLTFSEFYNIKCFKQNLADFIDTVQKESRLIDNRRKNILLPTLPDCMKDSHINHKHIFMEQSLNIQRPLIDYQNILQTLNYICEILILINNIDNCLLTSLLYNTFLDKFNSKNHLTSFNTFLVFFMNCKKLITLEIKLWDKIKNMNYSQKRQYFEDNKLHNNFYNPFPICPKEKGNSDKRKSLHLLDYKLLIGI